MLDRWFRIARFAALALLLSTVAPALADDEFTVAGVHEDVTAANALAARDQAQAEGQAKAFGQLMDRLAPGKAPHLSSAQITDLVIGFEVANERTSTVRYVADYTFHFNPAAVKHLLEDASIAMAPAAPRPMVLLPVFTSGGRADLWDDPNPWRDAWTHHPAGQDQLPIVVPVGDLADVATIDAPKAVAGDRAAIKAIAARYQNDDVLVVQGRFGSEPGRFEIVATRYTANDSAPPRTMSLATTAKPGEAQKQQLERSVDEVIAALSQALKSGAPAVADAGAAGTINVTLASTSLADWVVARNRLRAVPAVRGTALLSFDKSQIRIAIRYVGDQSQFRTALGEHGLELGGADPDWTLVLHAAPQAATAPPAPAPTTDKVDRGSNNLESLRKPDE